MNTESLRPQVILFGAGDGALKYLSNQSELNVIAIVDNDIKKHGKLIHDIQISSPTTIPTLSFDQIIIVTQWAKEVYDQLTTALNIDPSKIIIPPKELLKEKQKPFFIPETRNLAREIIKQFSASAKKHDIHLFVDFGTLLGLVRDNDVIEWDDDVDFSVLEEEKSKVDNWINILLDELSLPITLKVQSKISEKSTRTSYLFHFTSTNPKYISFYTSVSFRRFNENHSIHLPSGGMWYSPKEHFENHEFITRFNTNILVPHKYENYLTFLYGDWKTPKKEISMADYANLGNVTFDELCELGFEYESIKS